jgi:hypothetical protein
MLRAIIVEIRGLPQGLNLHPRSAVRHPGEESLTGSSQDRGRAKSPSRNFANQALLSPAGAQDTANAGYNDLHLITVSHPGKAEGLSGTGAYSDILEPGFPDNLSRLLTRDGMVGRRIFVFVVLLFIAFMILFIILIVTIVFDLLVDDNLGITITDVDDQLNRKDGCGRCRWHEQKQ